jgi:polyhydroxybutyrate depolymerase
MRCARLALLLALCAGPATAQSLPPGIHALQLEHGGRTRLVVIHRPRQDGPLPLVVMLHGAGDSARNVMTNYGWDRLGDRAGVAVIAPQGVPARPDARDNAALNPNVWNDGSGRFGAARLAIDDVAFIAAAIDLAAARLPVDPARVYLAGMSNGASMAFRAGAALPGRFAAVAAVASHFWDPPPRIAPPVSLLFIAGARDPLNLLGGGAGRNPWGGGPLEMRPPMARSAEAWAAAVGCRAETEMDTELPPEFIHFRPPGVRWIGCPPGIAVVMITYEAMGHVWPGAARDLPRRLVGPPLPGVDATALIWDFFRGRRR